MEKLTHTLTPVPSGSADVVTLGCTGQAHFDPAALLALCSSTELSAADAVICDLLEEIAQNLDKLHRALARNDLAAMPQTARRIEVLADEYGLIEVAVAAAHIIRCLAQSDRVALAAVMARLERGFDAAVAEVWAFRDA